MKLNIRELFREKAKDETGAIAVIIVVAFTVLMGLVGMSIDLGALYTQKQKAQAACDLAALAGAEHLPNQTKAEDTAMKFAKENGFKEGEIVVTSTAAQVKVNITRTNRTYFVAMMGINKLDAKGEAVAAINVESTPEQEDFDYAIFSANKDVNLNFTGSGSIVDGKIHSNAAISGGGITYKQASAVKGGNFGWGAKRFLNWNSNGTANSDDWPNARWGSVAVPNGDEVPMPYYLGDAIMQTINDAAPSRVPPVNYDKVFEMTKTQSDGGNELKSAGVLDQTGNIKIIPKGGIEFGYKFNPKAKNIYIYNKSGGSINIQFAKISNINANIFIDANGGSVRLYSAEQYSAATQWNPASGAPTVINGNVFCSNGNLQLGNMRINGNVYVDGKLTTDGGTMEINAPVYVYAKSIGGANTMNMTGAVVSEGDMTYSGGRQTFNGENNFLSLYSVKGNIKMGNDGEFRGLVYAPYGNITTTGSTSDFYGRLIADTITLGNSLTVHIPSEMLLPKDMIDNINTSASSYKKVARLVS